MYSHAYPGIYCTVRPAMAFARVLRCKAFLRERYWGWWGLKKAVGGCFKNAETVVARKDR